MPERRDAGQPAWLHGHAHEPNPAPPHAEPTVLLTRPAGPPLVLTPGDLARLPQTLAENCMIASTGHPASGPFTFGGVRLADLLACHAVDAWDFTDIVSADGFGARITAREALTATPPILLAITLNGAPMTRAQGLVRLIVPTETGDALRQVKWVTRVEVH